MSNKLILSLLIVCLSCTAKKMPTKQELKDFRVEQKKILKENHFYQQKILSDHFRFSHLEILYVSSGEKYYSWFGHILLRFVGSGEQASEDLVVGFVADFNDFHLDVGKAYYGGPNGYTVLAEVKPLKEYIRLYSKIEKRTIDRYKLNVNNDLVHEKLKKWLLNPAVLKPYSFRRNSCTALMLNLLATANNKIDSSKVLFPIEVIQYLKTQKVITKKAI